MVGWAIYGATDHRSDGTNLGAHETLWSIARWQVDGSEFMQNATVIAPERVDLGGFEEYVSLAKEWCRCITPDRHVCVTLPGGKVLHGRLHKEWSVDGARSLMGRTVDLRSAYKQIAVHPDHRRYAVVSVIGPDGKAAFFVPKTLLFCESAAVYSFNRVARALQRIAIVLGDLVMVNYFDDYPLNWKQSP